MINQMSIFDVFQEQRDVVTVKSKIAQLQKPGDRISIHRVTITKATRFYDVKVDDWHEIIYTSEAVIDFVARALEGRIYGENK